MDHILSIVLFTPLVGLLVLMFIPSSNAHAVKLWANVAAFVGFLVSLPLVFNFDPGRDFQFQEKESRLLRSGRVSPLADALLGKL